VTTGRGVARCPAHRSLSMGFRFLHIPANPLPRLGNVVDHKLMGWVLHPLRQFAALGGLRLTFFWGHALGHINSTAHLIFVFQVEPLQLPVQEQTVAD
jgi:hypothetical protein